MPDRHVFTEAEDALILAMRAERQTWDAIARAVGVSRNCGIERGKALLLNQDVKNVRVPRKNTWTPEIEQELRRLAALGCSCRDIGRHLGIKGTTVAERCQSLGIEIMPRFPLPAGDARTWGVLTAGTLLDGEPFR